MKKEDKKAWKMRKSVVKFCPLNRTWILPTLTHRSYDFLNQTYTSVPIIGLNELGRERERERERER